ncbi:hypothetical protein M5689_019692 [Euphorbia peplus]|nr:hypothetical protein M5689_019692 [Euphorbia peplus]
MDFDLSFSCFVFLVTQHVSKCLNLRWDQPPLNSSCFLVWVSTPATPCFDSSVVPLLFICCVLALSEMQMLDNWYMQSKGWLELHGRRAKYMKQNKKQIMRFILWI